MQGGTTMSNYAEYPYASGGYYGTGYVNPSYAGQGYVYPSGYAVGYPSRAALMMAGLGALIGGTAAAAKNIRGVREAGIDPRQAVRDTARETAGAAVATGVATLVMGYANPRGATLNLLGTIAMATGTKYIWDGATAGMCASAAPAAAAE